MYVVYNGDVIGERERARAREKKQKRFPGPYYNIVPCVVVVPGGEKGRFSFFFLYRNKKELIGRPTPRNNDRLLKTRDYHLTLFIVQFILFEYIPRTISCRKITAFTSQTISNTRARAFQINRTEIITRS